MRNVLIVLNYNDWETTNCLLDKIKNYQVFEKILVVDNASTDDSVQHIRKIESEKIELIINTENRGYACGNNFGIFYAIEHYHPVYLTIANPDIFVKEDVIVKMERALQRDKSFSLATAMVHKGYNVWNLPGFIGVLQSLFPFQRFLKKYFVRKRLERSREELEIVDVIEGSLFCARAEAMEKVRGFDDKTFLYVEENLLAARMRRAGYKSIVLPQEIYYHYHASSVGQQYKRKTQIFRFIRGSYQIYCKDYLHINCAQEVLFNFMGQMAYIERWVFDKIMEAKHSIHL